MVARSGTNLARYVAIPSTLCSFGLDVGGDIALTASTLVSSGRIPCSLILRPRNASSWTLKEHLSSLSIGLTFKLSQDGTESGVALFESGATNENVVHVADDATCSL